MLDNMSKRKPTKRHQLFQSVKQVAAAFGLCPFTLYEKIRLSEIPCYRFGRKILLDQNEVRASLRVPVRAKGGPDAA